MKKELVNKFDLESAFKALEEIEIPVVKGIKPNRENLQERFTKKLTTDILVEDYFDVNDQGDLEAAQEEREAEIAKAKLARIEKIVDLEAESEEDLLPSYVGKMIIQCPQCMTLFYKNETDIEKSEENPDVVNINETCQHCGNTSGYTLIGKVDKVGEEEAENYDIDDFDENELNLDFDAEEAEEEQPVEEEPAEEGNEEEIELEPVEETEEENSEEEEEVKESVIKQRIKLNNRSLKEAIIDDLGEALYTPGVWGVEFVGEECICFDNEQEARDYFYSLAKSDIYRDSEGIELFKVINENGDTDTIDVISIYDEEEEVEESLKEAFYAVIEADGKEERIPFENRQQAKDYLEVVKQGKDPKFAGKKIGSTYTEALTEAVDKELDDKLKAHNEYIEYLKEMIEKEEKSLASAKNDFVKKSIQSRIDALKADLEAALPEALKNEVEPTDLPTPEDVELEATENKEEKEETKESLKEAIQKNPNISAEEINKIVNDKTLSQKEKVEKIYEDVKIISDLSDYEPWSGAVDTWKQIQDADKVDELDSMLEDTYPDGLTMTELNDLLWFDSEWVLSSLGIIEEVEESLNEETTTLDKPKAKSPARNKTERLTKALAQHPLFNGISDRIIQRYLIPLYLEDDQNAELSVEAIADYFKNDVGLGKVIMDNIDDLTENQVKNLAKNDPVFVEAVKKFLIDSDIMNRESAPTINTLIKDLWFALGKDANPEEGEIFDPTDEFYIDFKNELFDIYNKMFLSMNEDIKNSLKEDSREGRVSTLKRSLTTTERLVRELSQHEMFKGLSVRTIQRTLLKYYIENMGRENLTVEGVLDFFNAEGFGTYVLDHYVDLEQSEIKELLKNDPIAVAALEEFAKRYNLIPEEGTYSGSYFDELYDCTLGVVYQAEGEFDTLAEIEAIYNDLSVMRPVKEELENKEEISLTEANDDDLATLLDSEEFKKPISDKEVQNIIKKYESIEEDVEPGIESELAIQDIVDTWESLEDLDEESFNKLTESYLKEVYSNVKSFKATTCNINNNNLIIEGVISFNSGKTKPTTFTYTMAKKTDSKVVLEGLNADFASEKAFILNCNITPANCLIVESLNYKYNINNTLVEGLLK